MNQKLAAMIILVLMSQKVTSFLKDQMEVLYFTIELQFPENGSTLKHTANLKEDLSTGFKFFLDLLIKYLLNKFDFCIHKFNLNHLIAIPLSQEENDFLADLGTTHLGWSNGVEGAQAQRFLRKFSKNTKENKRFRITERKFCSAFKIGVQTTLQNLAQIPMYISLPGLSTMSISRENGCLAE